MACGGRLACGTYQNVPEQLQSSGGRPRQDPEARALCEKFTPAAIATLAEIMGNEKAQPSARVAAAMAILKKTLPDLASLQHTGDGPRPFAVIPEVIESAAVGRPSSSPRLSISNLGAT